MGCIEQKSNLIEIFDENLISRFLVRIFVPSQKIFARNATFRERIDWKILVFESLHLSEEG